MISDLTYKVLALPGNIQLDSVECIDWAIEMLNLGYYTPNLNRLSKCNDTISYFEIQPILKNAIKELGLHFRYEENGVISYIYYYVKKITENKDVKQNLKKIVTLYDAHYTEEKINDFFFLYWAWKDIDYDNSNFNHYWEGANKSNIENIVIEEAIKWLAKNEKHSIQLSI